MTSGRLQTGRIVAVLAAMLLLATVPPAGAQLSRLDRATLIDGLGQEGMSELLLHLMEVEPPDDPVLAERVKIAQYRIRYGDTSRPTGERIGAFNAALDTLRRMIRAHQEHEQRPMWQTDLGELLLFESLQAINQHAAAFHEFGVPTGDQRRAFERGVVEALDELSDADHRFSRLQLELAREPDHKTKRIDTGLWDRMIGQYYQLRTQYFLAHAAYGTALLDDDHPYFRNLGGNARNPKVRGQAREPGAERRRLLQQCVERVTKLARDETDPHQIRRSCLSLAGRALTLLDDPEAAHTYLDQATAGEEGDLTDLLARLGKARLLHRDDQPSAAFQLLDSLARHPQAGNDLAMRLLIADQRFRLISASARSRPPEAQQHARAEAYDIYLQLLADPKLNAVQSEGLKFHIYGRWAESREAGGDPSLLPPAVVLAIGETARIEGQNLTADAHGSGDEQRSQELRARAAPKLKRAVEVLTNLIERPDLTATTRAPAMYNLGLAVLLRDQTDLGNVLEAARLWIDLAEQMPDQADAERAISMAAGQIRLRHVEDETRAAVQQEYQRAMDVLFAHFPDTPATQDELFYYGAAVLMPAGRMAEAFDVLAAVPSHHPDHLPARVQMLRAQVALYHKDDPEPARRRAARIRAQVARLREDARIALESASAGEALVLRNASGQCPLILADLAMAEGHPAEAAKVLESFADEHGDDPELLRQALGKRIVNLAGAGDFDAAVADAERMMRRFPDEASWVIDKTLTDLDEQVDLLRKRAATELVDRRKKLLEQQARNNATTASRLAGLLLEWARTQSFDDERMLPYRLIHIKSLRLAGRAEQALKLLGELETRHRDDAGVIQEAGEIRFALGGQENLVRSAVHFNRIIMSFQQPPFPEIWWNAWVRRFQIMDTMNRDTRDIPLRVQRLRKIDPNLGGERYRVAMVRLEKKYGH